MAESFPAVGVLVAGFMLLTKFIGKFSFQKIRFLIMKKIKEIFEMIEITKRNLKK